MSSRLQDSPPAQRLSEEVSDFYGGYLSYIENKDFPSTLYVVNLQHAPVALKNVEVRLKLGTNRIAEALTHELLHLHLLMLGFPLGDLVEVPLQLNHHAKAFLGMCNWVVNIIHHEINFQKFVMLGLEKRHFLARLTMPTEGQDLVARGPQGVDAPEVGFSRWCMEYIRHLFTARHGGSPDHLQYAQDVLDWGARSHPELKRTAAEINRWLETGAFKDPEHYPQQVNLLLDLMRIPRFTGWVTLTGSEQKRPVAVRLDSARMRGADYKDCQDRRFNAEMEC